MSGRAVGSVGFRPLARSDFPLLAAWLTDPVVARWWNHDTSAEGVERDFRPSVDGSDPAEFFLALDEDGPFGLIQRYPIAAYPEYVEEFEPVYEVPDGALSIDYLIGEPAARGRGLGAAMIASFIALSWTAHPTAGAVVVPVAAGNTASWRALESAGLRRVAEVEMEPDNPIDPRDHYVYRVDRPAAGTATPGASVTAAPP